jgi:hypothetical protein
MATAYAHIVRVYKARTGLPRDACVNTWSFKSDVLPAGDLITQAMANLQTIYTTVYNGVQSVEAYLSNVLEDDANSVEMLGYDVTAHLDGSVTGPPLRTENQQRGNSQAIDNLPSEVAGCLSFRTAGAFAEGPPAGPRLAARHRGRVYFGPLNLAALQQDVAQELEPVLNPDFIAALTGMAQADDINTGNVVWSVWSRANAAMGAVFSGFVDNEFDTQRRRGEKATVRTNWFK